MILRYIAWYKICLSFPLNTINKSVTMLYIFIIKDKKILNIHMNFKVISEIRGITNKIKVLIECLVRYELDTSKKAFVFLFG